MATPTAFTGQAPIYLGPLTTTFTPPPACTTVIGEFEGGFLGLFKNPKPFAFRGMSCSKGEPADATSCWPPISSGAPISQGPLKGIYSPGVECPVGYATACSATAGGPKPTNWDMQFQLAAGETAVGCCPSGYSCANIDGQICQSTASLRTVTMATCDGEEIDSKPTTVDDLKEIFTFYAPMIQINWQSSDKPDEQTTATSTDERTKPSIPTLTPAVPTDETNPPNSDPTQDVIDTGAAPTATGDTPIVAPTPTDGSNTNSPPSQQEQEGAPDQQETPNPQPQLSQSTKIGIGVAGGAVAAVGIILAVFYFWRRRNSRDEDAELDRLYGMKHVNTGSSSDLTAHHAHGGHDDIPGWYRGARPFSPLTPTVRVASASGRGLMPPTSPYYRPYRPNMSS
ncbi:proline-rich receptor-like protein kinase PERK2 [Rhypophila sp. PSN 637]